MFDRIEMDVVDTTIEVAVIAYLMRPEAPLPKISLPPIDSRCAASLAALQQMLTAAGGMRFDNAPALTVRSVALRQRPDRM